MKYSYIKYDSLLYKNITEDGFFRGYASTFNIKDHQGDVILPKSFTKTIASNPKLKLLWQHDHQQPIGIINHMMEDDHGLLIEGRLLLDLQKAKDVYSLIKNQVVNGLSIGYTIDDYYLKGSVRYLSQVSLLEVSVVTFPANQDAGIHYIKSNGQYLDLIEAFNRANNVLVGGIGIEPTTSTMST